MIVVWVMDLLDINRVFCFCLFLSHFSLFRFPVYYCFVRRFDCFILTEALEWIWKVTWKKQQRENNESCFSTGIFFSVDSAGQWCELDRRRGKTENLILFFNQCGLNLLIFIVIRWRQWQRWLCWIFCFRTSEFGYLMWDKKHCNQQQK